MFKTITRTWNPFTGCRFDCYNGGCWAKRLAEGKLTNSYPNGFIPQFHPERLNTKFKAGDFVFVSSMGDISFADPLELIEILEVIENNQQAKFLIQTKNPVLYAGKFNFPPNVYHGCTIETNRPYPKTISKALAVDLRYAIMASLEVEHKFLSIEPVMDFDLSEFSTWIYDINPEIVEIGADNYGNHLPEPSWDKVSKLIEVLTLHGIKVIQKEGLGRLKDD